MKRTIKSVLSILIVGIMVLSLCAINVSAASNTVIYFTKNSIEVAESVTVTVTYNADEAMYGLESVINYDTSILEYKSGAATDSAGVLKIVESPSGEKKMSYKLTFTAKKAGSCPISVSDSFFSGQIDDFKFTGTAANLTVTDKTLSANANLRSLYLSSARLTPSFSPNTTVYNVKVKNSVTECKISATTADPGAKVTVEGSATLKVGDNTRTVVVTAPSGAVKRYTVNINRAATNDEIPVETDPLEVKVEGAKMLIATNISTAKLFEGFTATKAEFNGTDVAVAVDGEGLYTLYYLRSIDNDILVPYTYDENNGIFEKLKYISQGENSYIFTDIPNDKTMPEHFYATNAQIAGMNVKCYASSGSNMGDFYYIYCYANGKYGFYRYDSRENVIQRYPELELTEFNVDSKTQNKDFSERFSSLTSNAKIIVIAGAFVLLAVVILVVILIIKMFRRNKYDEFDEDEISEDDFDDVMVINSNYDKKAVKKSKKTDD